MELRKSVRNLMLAMVASVITLAAAWTMTVRLEPGFLLPGRIAENPKESAIIIGIMLLLIFYLIVLYRAYREVSNELKEEREEIENKYRK